MIEAEYKVALFRYGDGRDAGRRVGEESEEWSDSTQLLMAKKVSVTGLRQLMEGEGRTEDGVERERRQTDPSRRRSRRSSPSFEESIRRTSLQPPTNRPGDGWVEDDGAREGDLSMTVIKYSSSQ